MIPQQDIDVLAKYDFNNERTTVLGVVTENNQQRLGEVRKIDITCWNIFRSWFGFGPLARTKISLPDLSSYFLAKNIDTLKAADDESTPEAKAHKTLCEIAIRNMNQQRKTKCSPTYYEPFHPGTGPFWKHLATKSIMTKLGPCPISRHLTVQMLYEWACHQVLANGDYPRSLHCSLVEADGTCQNVTKNYQLLPQDFKKVHLLINGSIKKLLD